ncbi:MAG: hypothetical protein Q8P24_00195 [Desulfobacterales bacterium]|nr:hypothetical protein [Desulfobacterales bacterium]
MKNILVFTGLILICFLPDGRAGDLGAAVPGSFYAETIPPRPRDAIGGPAFARQTAQMTGAQRQEAALNELRRGNTPEFLRHLKPVRLSYAPAGKREIRAVVWVMPDYLAIGSTDDFLRMPLDYWTAIDIANTWGFILPTRRIVDAIYKQSPCHLKPDPLPPGPEMRSSAYYLEHRSKIKAQREKAGCALGELTSGHKKDVVLSNRLNEKPGRIAIYGWHRQTGKPIQPLSTVHGERYADYSHGVRLVYQTVWIDEKPRSILDVLQDPDLAPVLTYEGVLRRLLHMIRL